MFAALYHIAYLCVSEHNVSNLQVDKVGPHVASAIWPCIYS